MDKPHYTEVFKHYLNNHFHKFTLLWLVMACIPLVFLQIYKYFLPAIVQSGKFKGLITSYIFSGIIIAFLCISLGISVWTCFLNGINSKKKIAVLLIAYFILWILFTNIYYFFNCVDEYFILSGLATSDNSLLHMTGLKPFWLAAEDPVTHQIVLEPANHFYNYIGCLFYSADTMSTIGSNDMVTTTNPGRIFTMIQAFAGQVVTIVAIGMFFSGLDDK